MVTTNNLPYREIRRNDKPIMWRPVTEYRVIYIDGEPYSLTPGKDVELLNTRTGQHWRNDPGDFVENWELTEEDRAVFEQYYPGILDGEE